jgi:hypothetical protein
MSNKIIISEINRTKAYVGKTVKGVERVRNIVRFTDDKYNIKQTCLNQKK